MFMLFLASTGIFFVSTRLPRFRYLTDVLLVTLKTFSESAH